MITRAPYRPPGRHKPPFLPAPEVAHSSGRAVPEAALQERLLTPKHRCEYNSSTSHLCFLKTRPPAASASLTVWIAHCTADYWFCFSPALLLRPSHVLSFPLSKQLTSCKPGNTIYLFHTRRERFFHGIYFARCKLCLCVRSDHLDCPWIYWLNEDVSSICIYID